MRFAVATAALAGAVLLPISIPAGAAKGPDGRYHGTVTFKSHWTTPPDSTYSAYDAQLDYTLTIDAKYADGQIASTPLGLLDDFTAHITSTRSFEEGGQTCTEVENTTYTPTGAPEHVGSISGQPTGVGDELNFRVSYDVHKHVDRSGNPPCTSTPFDQTYGDNSTQQCLGRYDGIADKIVLDHLAAPSATKTCSGTLVGPGKPGNEPDAVATVTELRTKSGTGEPHAFFVRDGKTRKLTLDTELQQGDAVITDKNTIGAFEFATGGRFGLNPSAAVKILSERTAGLPSFRVDKGGIWAKCDKLKEPLEVETNGGVTAIKG